MQKMVRHAEASAIGIDGEFAVVCVALPHKGVVVVGDEVVHDRVFVVLLRFVERLARRIRSRTRIEEIAQELHLVQASLPSERRPKRDLRIAHAFVIGEDRHGEPVFVVSLRCSR